jgi:hypothetical protein
MLKRPDAAAHFAAVLAFGADVAAGYYCNNFPSTRKRRR